MQPAGMLLDITESSVLVLVYIRALFANANTAVVFDGVFDSDVKTARDPASAVFTGQPSIC